MSDSWNRSGVEVELTGESREFFVSAELFVSTVAGAALRKPPNSRKKGDKRDSVKPLNNNVDEKKVKEKSSWLSTSKVSSRGHWRSATCKLSEEGERCLLNIYVDESILYQTVYIHLLNHTDIRLADMSLFLRKNCLVIHCPAKRWTPSNTNEPVYLQFSSIDACNTWLALLRSYALPEIYGRWFFPSDGGSYRMWRQVDLTIISGRNLGNSKPFEGATDVLDDGAESTSEHDPVDLDVYCEIHLNNTLCARTTVKKGIGSPDWHESFVFSDLPPFDYLDVIVWREKKLFKPAVLGLVRIALSNFRRGEAVEGWFPVLQSGSVASDLQVGEIKMKARVDEEIILPSSSYSKLLKTFNSRNFLDWLTEFETKLKLKSAASQLMSIAIANNTLIEQVQDLANKEVDGSQSSHQTLFRGNTILTKIMELCMNWYGKPFLEASIGTVLRRLCSEKVAIEVDPMRSGKSPKDVERNVELLIYWCQEFWNQIYSVREECPLELKRLFGTIRELVEKRYSRNDSFQDKRELRWQSVSAFCFLRFIVPAILHPHLFGLYPGLPSVPVQRSLTLIAKVIQSLANLNVNAQKEEFMRGLKDFLSESVPAMIDYIVVVSTPSKDTRGTTIGRPSERQERLDVIHALRERAATMPVLHKESIPILPHTLDIPRQLAIITSAIIRHSRTYFLESKTRDPDSPLQELCSRCFEVEKQALQRVSQLAAQLSAHQKRQYPPGNWSQSPRPEQSPPSPAPVLPPSPRSTSSARSGRPSTAPSPLDTGGSRHFESTSGNSTRAFGRIGEGTLPSNPSSPVVSQPKNKLLHLKSTSTDSISSYVNRDSPVTTVDPSKTDSFLDPSDDPNRRKKRLLRVWRR